MTSAPGVNTEPSFMRGRRRADTTPMGGNHTSDLTCDRCGEPATVTSPLGRLCSRHAREETERDSAALRRRAKKAPDPPEESET